MDIPTLLQQIPPGVDVFDFLAQVIEDQVYPSLGKAFAVQVYVVPILCCAVIAIISAGLSVQHRKARLRFLVEDGPATRLNPRLFVPVLWLIGGICMIIHTFLVRSTMDSRHLTYALGVYWWTMATPLLVSYAIISTSAMCSAPIIRRCLMRLNAGHSTATTFTPSFIVLHTTMVFVVVLITGSTFGPGCIQGSAFKGAHKGYTGIQLLLAQAKESQSMVLLASAGTWVSILEKATDENRRATYIGGIIFSIHVTFFALSGIFPLLFLNIYMKKRINRLQRDLTASSQQNSASLEAQSTFSVHNHKFAHETFESSSKDLPINIPQIIPRVELPKDRPFANLAPSPALPRTYANIFKSHVDGQEKARRLKAALRRDNTYLAAYLLMLFSLGSCNFFQAAKGPWAFDIKNQFLMAYTWEVWGYLVPALMLAVGFLYDGLTSISTDEEVDSPTSVLSGRMFQAPALASIQLSQTVQVVEEHPLEEKVFSSEKRSMYDRFGSDRH